MHYKDALNYIHKIKDYYQRIEASSKESNKNISSKKLE